MGKHGDREMGTLTTPSRHCERSEAIPCDSHVADAPRNDRFRSFEVNYFMLLLISLFSLSKQSQILLKTRGVCSFINKS